MSTRARVLALCVGVLGVLGATPYAHARPTYFDVFTTRYSITASDRLYACGVCHYKWTGTGARNPFGNAVEQQLYIGKPINQALEDVETADSDADGFTNVDEILNFMTLPGYSCANFFDAIGAPSGYDTYITPMVASCLEPLDIRVSPTTVSVLANANDVVTETVTIYNNGSDFPLNISSYGLEPGTHSSFSISGPPAPLQIALNSSIAVEVTFAPLSAVFAGGTLRISSDDPDEPTLDVSLAGIGVNRVLAPADERAACLRTVDSAFRRYTKAHLQQWGRCYADEVAGRACDGGLRDVKIARAAARLRAKVGGSADRRCAGIGLKPFPLGFDSTCGGSCGDIVLSNMSALADCLVCRQDEATSAALAASTGATPPDLPAAVGSEPAACGRQLIEALAKGVVGVQKLLGRCEVGNITAATPVDCVATTATDVTALRTRVDGQLQRCGDTTDLGGCLFEVGADPTCLGATANTLGSTLVDATIPH